ncbi:MAG: aminotransferase class V-fold PLP-dependent enzyme, partial [bacterium]
MILLNPGPVTISERVRQALLRPDLCHREPEFTALQQSIRTQLLGVYGLPLDHWAAVLLTGSGTAAVEAMMSTLIKDTDSVLILENGLYGERLTAIAGIHGLHHLRLHHAWDRGIDLDAVRACLDQNRRFHYVALVHHETTTGRLNSIAELAEICKARGVHLLVDGVSSFGAEHLDFTRWNIAACAATANKCLHGVPGVSFVIVQRKLLPFADQPPRSLYLDLRQYCEAQDAGSTPYTQTVQGFYALDEALSELEEEGGWSARQRRYREHLTRIREGLAAVGIRPLLPAAAYSVVLNSFHLPEGMEYLTLHD